MLTMIIYDKKDNLFTKLLLNNSAVEMDTSLSVTSGTDVDFFRFKRVLTILNNALWLTLLSYTSLE